jgi:drug/metabolite transporter (DMT)-like permease
LQIATASAAANPCYGAAVTTTTPSHGQNRTTLAIGLVLAAMLGFAVMDGLTKLVSAKVPIPQIMFVRNVVFSVAAITLLMWRRPGVRLRVLARSTRPLLQLARAALLIIESAMFMLAFSLMPLADVHAINAATPLLVVALSVPLLGETVGWRRWAAVLAGFVGVLLIIRPGYIPLTWPVLLVLVASSMWGLYQILVRIAARSDSTDTTSLWTALVGLGMTSAAAPFVWTWPDAASWGLMACIAVLGTFGHMALISALGLTEPSRLQPFTYGLFLWAIVVGFVMFGDMPDRWTLAGAAIIIASGLYAWHRERLRADEKRTG